MGAPCRQGRAGGAAQAQGLRHAAQGHVGADQRALGPAAAPRVGRASRRAQLRAVAPAAHRCRFRPRRRRPARALRAGQPDVQRLHDRPEHPDHRRRLRPRRPSRRRRGDALPARPRARARPERARRLPDPPAPPAGPDGGPVRPPGRRPGRAGHHRRPDGVVAQGRAVGRPCRPARRPESGRGHPGAHEARLRRQPRRPGRHLVLRAGQRVHRDRGPPRLRSQALPGRDPEPSVRRRPLGGAAPVDRVGGVHRDPRRHLPAPRGRRHRQGQRRRAGGGRQLQPGLRAHPGRAWPPGARPCGLPRTGPDLARRALPPAAAAADQTPRASRTS